MAEDTLSMEEKEKEKKSKVKAIDRSRGRKYAALSEQ